MKTIKRDYVSDDEFYQSEAWVEIRRDILERDSYSCRTCGTMEELSVHHIVPRKYKYIVDFDIDDERNLMTLCWRCHGMADRKVDIFGREIE